MDQFRVSVIIPTYNRADLIAETLDSVLSQSHPAHEVIVVDDGSEDDTEAIVQSFGPKVRYIRIENSGECSARNAGVALSTGDWVAFCDSDDVWLPTKLELQVRVAMENPEVEYVFTNFKHVVHNVWCNSSKFEKLPIEFWDIRTKPRGPDTLVVLEPLFARLLCNQPIFPSTLMMKRSFFFSVGKWNEDLGRTPSVDLEFHLRCANHCGIGVVTLPVVGIRKHSANFSGNPMKTTVGEIEILRYVLKHNSEAWQHREAIREQIIVRSCNAAHLAFSNRDYRLALQVLQHVPQARRSFKLRIKAFLSSARVYNGLTNRYRSARHTQ